MKNSEGHWIMNAMIIPNGELEEIIANNSWVIKEDYLGIWYEDSLGNSISEKKVYEYLKNYFDVNEIVGISFDDTIACQYCIILYKEKGEN